MSNLLFSGLHLDTSLRESPLPHLAGVRTNRSDTGYSLFDPTLTRPGRFNQMIVTGRIPDHDEISS